MFNMEAISSALVNLDNTKLTELVNEALKQGISPQQIISEGLSEGMNIIGSKMETGKIFIPEVLMAARYMKGCLDTLNPLLSEGALKSEGTVIIGTVEGDSHDIGKNIVAAVLGGAGFKVHDIGVNVPPARFAQEGEDKNADFIGASALLTSVLPAMKKTIDVIDKSGLRGRVKVIVGGAPVTSSFADEIGADGYAPNAGAALNMLKKLLH